MISTSPSEVFPWSTVQELQPKEIPSRMVPPKVSTVSWVPSNPSFTIAEEDNANGVSEIPKTENYNV